ncbi:MULTISPECIES: AAA family ATPase [Chitinibacter]|uniref:AAA family ATPase n=1 Tax=Chitinibacter TaxID=230666 RepID=UPI0003F513A5|nr:MULTISPECIES: ATP-binding protein [Chitinibacter]
MTRKIAIVGPESCGKTSLARALARTLHAPWVPEFSRPWFAAQRRTSYSMDDILAIAHGQLALEQQLASEAEWLVCDTSVLVCIIWAQVRFGECPAELRALWRPADYQLHLLTATDLPWQPDPLRENPLDRDALLVRYQTALEQAQVPFALVAGRGEARCQQAVAALRQTGFEF